MGYFRFPFVVRTFKASPPNLPARARSHIVWCEGIILRRMPLLCYLRMGDQQRCFQLTFLRVFDVLL